MDILIQKVKQLLSNYEDGLLTKEEFASKLIDVALVAKVDHITKMLETLTEELEINI